jgi:RNA polymerase sigma factor (sigma-70 family)
MSETNQDFETLIERIRQGDQEAACILVKSYGPDLIRVIRRNLKTKLRSKYDSDDFLQEVWLGFFTKWVHEKDFNRPEEVIAFLATMAHSRVVEANRQYLQCQKRDLNREQSLEEAAREGKEPIAPGSDAAELAIAEDQWELLVQRLPPRLQYVLQALREGRTYDQIAWLHGLDAQGLRYVVRRCVREELIRQRGEAHHSD